MSKSSSDGPLPVVCGCCEQVFYVPEKWHPYQVKIACPHCRAALTVTLGVSGVIRGQWTPRGS